MEPNGNKCIGLFLNFVEALHALDHQILLHKFNAINYYNSNYTNLIVNYIIKRKHKVRIGNLESNYFESNRGVPFFLIVET